MIKIENIPPPLRKKGLEEEPLRICEENDLVFMGIFGSFVRGEDSKKSDIDIAIEFDENNGKSLLDLVRIEYELSKVFKRKVDLGILSAISPYIEEYVNKEMRIIYEKR